jgi:hypothetical protein
VTEAYGPRLNEEAVDVIARALHDAHEAPYIEIGKWPAWGDGPGDHDPDYIEGCRERWRKLVRSAGDALTAAGFVVVRADGLQHGDTLEEAPIEAGYYADGTSIGAERLWRVVERET